MKGKNYLLSGLIALFLIFGLIAPQAAEAREIIINADPTLEFFPATKTATTCGTVDLNVRVNDVVNLTGYHMEVTYDRTKVQVTEVVNGGFLSAPGLVELYEPTNTVDDGTGTGRLLFGMAQQGVDGDPVPKSGTGTLITIRLKSLVATGLTTTLAIDGTNSMLVNWPDAYAIPYTVIGGATVTLSSCAPTDIALSTAAVNENQPVGTLVGTLSATDPDLGDTTFTYSLVNPLGYPDNNSFQIVGNELKTNAIFDFETKASYQILVRVTGPHGLTYDEVFTVAVNDLGPVLSITGATADGVAMPGTLAGGFELLTNNDAAEDRLVQIVATTSEPLADDYFGLFFVPGESTVTLAQLEAYYNARNVPEPFLAFLKGAANGTNPFVYIKGTTVTLVDAAKHFILGTDVDMTIPDDFPLGTYVVRGNVADGSGNTTSVTLKLIVTGDRVAPLVLSGVAKGVAPYTNITADSTLTFTVPQGYVVSTIDFTMNEAVTVEAGTVVKLAGVDYGTVAVDATGLIVTVTPLAGNETAGLLGNFIFSIPAGSINDVAGNALTTLSASLIVTDQTNPVMEAVLPAEGVVTLAADETFVLTVDAFDLNLFSLEVDHSFEGTLPEFTVYASATNPWGSPEAKAGFDAAGMTVAYDETAQKWTIDFGETVTDTFIPSGVNFYMVLHDQADNKWGSMSPTTPENTFAYTFVVTNTLEPEITSAVTYVYTPVYNYVGDVVFDDPNNIFTATFSPAEFLAGGAVNDLARYLGALYRQDTSTIIKITFNGVEYTWDTTGTLKGSNWEDASGNTLVNAMVAYYFSPSYDPAVGLPITVNDGWHTANVTFKLLITNTLDDELESAPTYVYTDYTYVGDYAFVDATNIYTVTYDDVEFNPNAMYDLARYLGALYRQTGSTVTSIVYGGVTYTWDPAVGLQGSNWVDGSGKTLVSKIIDDFKAGLIDPAVGLVLTLGDGVHTENVTFKFVILDTIDPVVTITGATADTVAMTGNLADGFELPTTNDPAINHQLQIVATSSEPLEDTYFGLYLTGATPEQIAALQAYYATKSEPYKTYLLGALTGANPFVYIDGGSLTLVDAAQHDLPPNHDIPMVVPDDFPLGTYTVAGVVKDPSGNETTVTLKLVVTGDRVAPEVVSGVAVGATGFDPVAATVGLTFTVPQGYKVDHIEITMNEAIQIVAPGIVYIEGNAYGTMSASGSVVTVTPYAGNEVANMPGTFDFTIDAGSVKDLAGNDLTTLTATMVVQVSPIFGITDFGMWGDVWPGAYSLGWGYVPLFDTTTIASIEVGMLDVDRKSIVTYTAEGAQLVYQREEGYITATKLSSAPFYRVYNGNPIVEGPDSDWTVIFGESFDVWSPRWGYVEVTDIYGTVVYHEIEYTGTFGDLTAPTVGTATAIGADPYTDVIADGTLTFTVPQNYTVETIEFAMSEAVTVVAGTEVTLAGVPYGLVTVSADGLTLIVTPYPGNTIANLLGTFTFVAPEGKIFDLSGNPLGTLSATMVVTDQTAPIMEAVTPAEGLITLGLDDTFVLTVDAFDLNLYSLEVDHSFEGTLPEFTVYASATNPWGSTEAKAGFDSFGMTVAYDENAQKWTIDFGEVVTDTFIPGGVDFFMVLHDEADNKWGSMSPTTPENTFEYTFDVTNTLEPEITSAVTYVYSPVYNYVGDIAFDDPNNIFTATFSPAEFLAGGAMNDLARYLGALYWQDPSTIITIVYDGVTYTWNPAEPNTGSNWFNGTTSLVSAMVADYLAAPGDLVITVGDGWHTSDVTFKLVITNTLDDEIESAPAYVYTDYTYVGDFAFVDATNIYTVTYDDVEFNPNAMNDLARYLGALYRQDGSTVTSIVYDGMTYTWDETGTLKGSNWEDASGNTLISKIIADFQAGLIDPAVGLVLTVADGVHTENVTFKFVILDTIDPVVTIDEATADGNLMGGDLATGYILVTESVPTVDHLLQISAIVDAPLADEYFGLYFVEAESTVTAAQLKAYYDARGVPSEPLDFLGYLKGAADGTNPFVFINEDGLSLSLVDAAKHALLGQDVDMTIPDDFPVGTYVVRGNVADAAGNETIVTLKLIVVRTLAVTDADLFYGTEPTVIDQALGGDFETGFTMTLDPMVPWYYLDSDLIEANNDLAEGMYPFYLDPAQPAVFYVNVDAAGEISLIDGWLYQNRSETSPLRINGDFTPGTYTYTGSLTDIYGSSAPVSITITFNDVPYATAQSVTVVEDTPTAITLSGVDLFPGTMTYTVVTQPTHGTLSGTAPALTYTPAADFHGTDSFTFTLSDGTLTSTAATVSITVTSVLDAPTVSSTNLPGPYMVGLEQAFQVTLTNPDNGDEFTNVLARFRLEDITLADIASFQYLETSLEPDQWMPLPLVQDGTGVIGDFGPAAGFPMAAAYSATSQFKITFNTAGTYPATVVLFDVAADPDVELDRYEADAVVVADFEVTDVVLMRSVDQTAWFAVPGNFTDGFAMPLLPSQEYYYFDVSTLTATRPLADGSYPFYLTETPGADFFAYWADKDVVAGATGWQGLMWQIINGDAPMFFLVVDGTDYSLIDGLQGEPYLLRINGDYYPGAYAFSGLVEDEYGFTDAVPVDIIFNDIPVGTAQSVTTNEDTAATITLEAVDLYPGTLTWTVGTPTNGTLTGTAPDLTYTPNANWFGSDSFTFSVNDGTLTSALATVSITVTSVNDAPVAEDQNVAVAQDTPKAITLVAADIEIDPLTYTVLEGPTNGVLSGTAPNLTYTPNAGFNGLDSFTFKANDGAADSNIATVSITVSAFVNTPPVAVADTYETDQNVELVVGVAAGVLANDYDVDGDNLTATLKTNVTNGVLVLKGDGSFTYTPKADFCGTDSFVYTLVSYPKINADGWTAEATATITVYCDPIISSTDLDGPFYVGNLQEFHVRLQNPAPGRTYGGLTASVFVDDVTLADFSVVEVKHPVTGTWVPLVPVVDGTGLRLNVGPVASVPITSGLDLTLTFRVNFNTAGDYPVTGTLYDGAIDPLKALATYSDTTVVAGLEALDFGYMYFSDVMGVSAGFGNVNFDLSEALAIKVELFTGPVTAYQLLQTNTAVDPAAMAAWTQFSGPFDIFGTFDYVADNVWTNLRAAEYGQTAIPTRVLATVTLPGGITLTAENTMLSGDRGYIIDTLDEELASAPEYDYTPPYVPVGDIVFDLNSNTYTGTYTAPQVLAGASMNDMARYLGALYRQAGSTITSIVYNGTTYTWDTTGTLVASNWEDSTGKTLVSQVTDDFQAAVAAGTWDPDAGYVMTVHDDYGHDATVTFKMVILDTLDAEIASAPSYVYTPVYTYVGAYVFTDATNIYTVTYDDVAFNPNAMYDLARYLGALHRQTGATVASIDYKGVTYTWYVPAGQTEQKGSNWRDASGNTLVSVITAEFFAGQIDPAVGISLTLSDVFHTEDVTFLFVITDTIAPTITAMVANGAGTYPDVAAVDMTFTVAQGYTGEFIAITMNEPVTVAAGTEVTLAGVPYGLVTVSADGLTLTVTPYAGNEVANLAGTFTFVIPAGSVEDLAGNALTTLEATLIVTNVAPVAVDDAYTTLEDTVLTVAALGVLGNDVDYDAMTAVKVSDPANGTLTVNSDGGFVYTPKLDWYGTDSFTYKANDGAADGNTATVTITVTSVKDQVRAVDDFYETNEDTTLTIATPGVRTNDLDPDNNLWTASLVTDVLHGNLSLKGDGSFIYEPDPNFYGIDTFEYELVTYPAVQNLWTDIALVTITVHPVLDPPALSTDLPASVYVDYQTEFGVTLKNPDYGDAFTGVRVQFRLIDTLLSDITSLEYFETTTGTWMNLPLTQNGADVIGWFGPGAGFPMPAPYSATSQFRLTVAEVGTYDYEMHLYDVVEEPDFLLASLAGSLDVVAVDIFNITDFGQWGPVWPGALSLGWQYVPAFDTLDIASIEVGMLDSTRTSIIKYTADEAQIVWQRANGYITPPPDKLSSAPFYVEYNGNPIAEGRDFDWTVVFGPEFDAWDPAWGYVKVVDVNGYEEYAEIEYTGPRPDITAPVMSSMVALGDGTYPDVTAVGTTFTVEEGYVVDTIEITMSEPVTVVAGTEVTLAGVPYGLVTVSADGLTLIVTPYPGNEVASVVGTFSFVIPAGSVLDLAGNPLETLEATLVVTEMNIFEMTDFGMWGPVWPGAFSLGWGYLADFDLDMIASIEVGMLDASNATIVKYTADATQVAWQRANGYITDPGKLSSAPFYLSYNGNPIVEGPDSDWTVIFGSAFADWNPRWGYVKVITTNGIEDYGILEYTGPRPDITAPVVSSMVALGDGTYPDVTAVGTTFTVEEGYVVDTIEITMSEPVTVMAGTEVTLAGVPYGLVTVSADGLTLIVTPYAGNEVASIVGTFSFVIPAGSVLDLAGNPLETLEATLVVTEMNIFEMTDFGMWGPVWPGAFSLGWGYLADFDLDMIASIEVGMLDASNATIVKYTADATQVAWQRANGYITDPGKLSSAPFYLSYNGNPIVEGPDSDWTVIFGSAFADWNPRWGYVKVITTNGIEDYGILEYTGPRPDITAPVLSIGGATADGDAMGGTLEDGYVLITNGVPTLDRLVQFADGTVSSEPLANDYFGLTLIDSTVSAAELQAYYAARGVPEPYLTYLNSAADGTNPFVYINGTTVTLVDAAQHDIGGTDVDMTIPDDFPVGTYTVQGVVRDAAGNETTVTLILHVVRTLAVTDADLKAGTVSGGPYTALPGTFADGFVMELDPAVAWYYLDTDLLEVNNPLEDGLYPFFLAPDTTTPIFYVKVEGTNYTLIDSYLLANGGGEQPLRINGDFTPGTYTYTGSLTDIYGSTAPVSITITFNDIPYATDQSVTVVEDTPTAITLAGVDLFPGTLTYTVLTAPAHGTLSGTAPALTYTPDADFNGTDSFTFSVNDGTIESNIATVTITVTALNDAPVAEGQTVTTAEDTAIDITLVATDVDLDTLTYIVVDQPLHGTVTLVGNVATYTPALNYHGPDSFTFKANDGTVDSNVATVTITVTEVKDQVQAVDDAYQTNEDTTLTIAAPGVLANDIDVDENNQVAVLVSGVTNGTLTLNSDGSFVYVPKADWNGVDTFVYQLVTYPAPANLWTDEATVTITVNPVNDAPVLGLIPDATIPELVAFSFTATATDVDLPVQMLTYTLVGAPEGAVITPAGVFTWTPSEAQGAGVYTFTVKVCDDAMPALCDEQEVTLTVTEVNVAPVLGAIDDATLPELAAFSFTATATDADLPVQVLTYSLVGAPEGAAITPTGVFSWTPSEAQAAGVYTFTVKVCDDATPALCDEQVVTLTVTEVNAAPVAQAQSVTTPEDTAINITLVATDVDSITLTYAIVAQPAHGTVTLVGNVATYTPALDFNGTDTFTFKANDGALDSNVATVTITVTPVNDDPAATDDAYTTDEDVTLVVAAPGVLANDGDVDQDDLASYALTQPAHGTLQLASDGSFTYVPEPNWHGIDTFTYQLVATPALNAPWTDEATVTITVNSVNDTPVAVDDFYTTDEDTTLTVAAPGVLANDSDVDLDPMEVVLVTDVLHGDLSILGDGSFTYKPDPNFYGIDTFVYQLVTYPGLQSSWTDEATVTITVNPINDAPILGLIPNATIPELVPFTFTATVTDVDLPAQVLTYTLVGAPEGAAITAAGAFTWTPTEAQGAGVYTFTVKVCDAGVPALCDEQVVILTVSEVNTAPVAANQTVTTPEETALDVTLGATDADGDTLTYTIVAQPTHGTVTLVGTTATYTPDLDYFGPDSFTFKANDGLVDSNVATVTITVTNVNDAPVAVDDEYTMAEKETLTIAAPGVLDNDSDVDGDAFTAILVDNVLHGTLTLNADGSFTYTPNEFFNGTDSFTYKAKDAALESEMAVVTITVTPVNDWPIANDDFYEVVTGNLLVKDALEGVLANDVLVDPDEQVTIQILEDPQHGTLSMNDDGSFDYFPNPGYMGTDTFRYMVLSVRAINAEWSDDALVTITVKPYMGLFLPIIWR